MAGYEQPGPGREGMDDRAPALSPRVGRRTFLKAVGALGAAGIAAPVLSGTRALATTGARSARAAARVTPLQHVIIDCQENRSFDHYYGFAPFAGSAGVPPGYSQPDGAGGSVAPFEFTSLSTPDIGHSWSSVHSEWDAGKMDGFYTTDGINCMGYYTAAQLPYYYSLFDDFTLCGSYFCSVLGPTWPNRFYLAAGTSGGITTNGVWGYGVFDYPIILDLLEAAGVTWKVYNIGWDSVPFGNSDNVFVFWQRWAHDQRTRGSKGDYLNDLRLGRLPRSRSSCPASPGDGTSILRRTCRWGWESSSSSSRPCSSHRHGRVPRTSSPMTSTAVISTMSRRRSSTRTAQASGSPRGSSRRSRRTVFGLPTLASVNHRFDQSTPGGPNNQAAGGSPTGPPAPPRDGIPEIGNLMECFTF